MPYHNKNLPKKTSYLDEIIKIRIDEKVRIINKARPLSSGIVTKLKEQFSIEMTYNSNAIEGNKLTLKETFFVISEGITIKGKSLKDHLEAKDHNEALQHLFEMVEHDKRHTFSEMLIRNLHQLVVRETVPRSAGIYRTSNVAITGSKHNPPEAHDVPLLMKELVEWVRKNQIKLHPVELGAIVHHRIASIHPFLDGNGRLSRLVMNLLLMQRGFPLVVILKNDRKKYYDVLENADKGDLKPFVRFIAQAVERSMNIYIKAIIPARTKAGRYMTLSEVSRSTPYSAKYLNLLARYGKIEAHKEGRDWVTTIDAVKRYMDERKRKR